jgi:hypothetical protein
MKKINLLPKVDGVKAGVKNSFAKAAASATVLAIIGMPILASNFTIELVSLSRANMPKIIDLSLDTINTKTGDFAGEAVGEHSEIWEVNGTIAGNKVEIEFSGVNAGERIIASGEISEDGIILGKAATEDGELYEWEATDALANGAKT